MSKQIIDLSGLGGLLERHQGDLNDTSAQPNLRYLGADGSFADGIFNPMKTYGYLSPANNSFTTLTGTIAQPINSINYDPSSDTVFLSEEGENILKLDGLDDTSLANYLAITAGGTIKDALIYEANGQKSLVYAIDSNLDLIEAPGNSSSNVGGMYVGFKTLDTKEGITVLEKDVLSAVGTASYELKIGDAASYSRSILYRKIAQEFATADAYGQKITGVSLRMRRSAGTGSGITMKVSIQERAVYNTGIYTSRGAWSNAVVNYAINDTVDNLGVFYQCIQAHSAAATANDEPGVGSNWYNYWNIFAAPSGTELASGTFLLSDVPVLANKGADRFTVEFSSTAQLSSLSFSRYWIVIEEVGSVMTASDSLAIMGTVNGDGIYDGYTYKGLRDTTVDYWLDAVNTQGNGYIDNIDFRLICNRDDNWTANTGLTGNSSIIGYFGVETGQESFLYRADNGLLYWFVENHVHTIDGSITGGGIGKATEDVLLFPSYIRVADVAETRSRMYIGIHTNERSTVADPRNFSSANIGVYIWDRRTQVQGTTDFYPAPGAKEIKSLFTSSSGDVLCITTGNSGFTEMRGITGNQYAVLHTFETSGYPQSRRGVSQIDNMSVWLGANGIFYAYGAVTNSEKKQLYKIGSLGSYAGVSSISGPVFLGNETSDGKKLALLAGVGSFNGVTLTDSYPEQNFDTNLTNIQSDWGAGQTFVASGGDLDSVKFYLTKNTGSGNINAKLYATSAGAPTGSPLATSDTVLASSLPSVGAGLITFDFSTTVSLTAGVTYYIGAFASSFTGVTFMGVDGSSPNHSGSRYAFDGSTFSLSPNGTIFYVYENITTGSRVLKWYPNGQGTIASVSQIPNQGDIFTKVYTLPSLATVKYLRLMMAPGTATGTTTIANLKCYYNQSSTAAWTKAITLDDIHKGWKNIEINKNNINFIQFEIEYVTSITLGASDFKPMYIELEYADENRINP